jgi:hypothetical protein
MLLGLSSDLSEHIPPIKIEAIRWQTGYVALRGYDVHHHYLRREMVGECRSLMEHMQRGVRKINRKKNFLDIHHLAPPISQTQL